MPQNLQNTRTFFSHTASANVGSSSDLSTIVTNTINSNIYLSSYEVRSIRMVNWSASGTNVSLYINQYSTNVLYLVGKRFVPAGNTVNFADRYESFVMHDNDILLGNTDILGTNVTVTVNIDEYTETDPRFIPLTAVAGAGGPVAYDILMIGGGGGGGQTFCSPGNTGGGGGGGGGVLYTTVAGTLTTGTSYPVVIGGGGAQAVNGNPTCFLNFCALGGGRGGYNNAASPGGSGGGSSGTPGAGTGCQPPAGVAAPIGVPQSPYEKYRGLGSSAAAAISLTGAATNGAYASGRWNSGGGGGGAQAGIGGGQYGGGGGGAGVLLSNFTYWGTDASNNAAPASGKGYFAGGGQGGGWWGSGAGAAGGGGRGGYGRDGVQGQPGVAATGGGAGGGGGSGSNESGTSGGTGGSGLLIVRYAGSAAAATGGVVTICNGFVHHVFCSTGNFTFTN